MGNLSWKEVVCVVFALMLPVLCGFSAACSRDALKDVIFLSSLVVTNVVTNASNRPRVPSEPEAAPKGAP